MLGSNLHFNQSGDAFPLNPTQWNDTDGDNYGDNWNNISHQTYRPTIDCPMPVNCWPGEYLPDATEVDVFPVDPTQWADYDGDWFGDQPFPATRSDACVEVYGTSYEDRGGCLDSDGDGWSDPSVGWEPKFSIECEDYADAFPFDNTQWCDSDGDGFGDNPLGNQSDDCVGEYGKSYQDKFGCPDDDGDGWSNYPGDAFPNDPTQWNDSDGDGGDSQMMKSLHVEIIKLGTTQIFSQVMEVNVKIRMVMDTATIMYQVEMRFRMMELNGMILMETDLEITHTGITGTFVRMTMLQM